MTVHKVVILRSNGVWSSYHLDLAAANRFIDKHLNEMLVLGDIFCMAAYDAENKCVRLANNSDQESF